MIIINGKPVRFISFGTRAISAVYRGIYLVWQSIRSCFGSGGWDNHKEWDNHDGWNNG